jgi:hypothetical protein
MYEDPAFTEELLALKVEETAMDNSHLDTVLLTIFLRP